MKFSLTTVALVGAATSVFAAPAPQNQLPNYEQEGQPVVYTSDGAAVTIQPFTTRAVLSSIGAGPTGLPLPFNPAEGIAGGAGEFGPVNNQDNPFFGPNANPEGPQTAEPNYNYTVVQPDFGNNPNQNELGGVPGNAGAVLGSGTNAFGTSTYNYNGLDQQAGQSSNGAYGPNSGGDRGFQPSQGPTSGQFAPSASTTIFFRLVANATGDDFLHINGFNLATYHINAGSSIAHFTSPSGGTAGANAGTAGSAGSKGTGRVFYTNGTSDEVANGFGTTVTSGGTDPFPESIVLTDGRPENNVAASQRGNVYINAGLGTQGVQVATNSNGILVLTGAGDDGFFACYNENVPYDSTYTLAYVRYGDQAPDNCEQIVLIPECSDSDGNRFTIGEPNANQRNEVLCYDSVLDIDWSQYPST